MRSVDGAIASQINQQPSDYIFPHSERRLTVDAVLFRRDRKIILKIEIGDTILSQNVRWALAAKIL